VAKNVKWPTGIGAKGNEGVAAQLTQLRGAIGYAEAAYVKQPLQAAALTWA
jgi:phosphate transport system substrate-binding protein